MRPTPIRCIVSTEWFGDTEASDEAEPISDDTSADRDALVQRVVDGYELLMHRLADSHAPEFLEIAITMPQAKLVYLLAAARELHMSELVARLGVSLSTVSGLVDRLVEQDLAARRDDPEDRRQVVVSITDRGMAFVDRFRELNAGQLRQLLAVLDDAELGAVSQALSILGAAAERRAARQPSPSVVTKGKGTP